MPYYHKAGKIPEKRHIQFRKPDGNLYAEELVSTEGFSSMYSLVYHCHPPTLVKSIGTPIDDAPVAAIGNNMQNRSFLTFRVPAKDDFLESRTVQLFNSDLNMTTAAPRVSMTDYFYKNADADEVIFVHEGSGRLKTLYGTISFEYGDYLVIPRGVIYQLEFNDTENRLLIIESFSPVKPPKRYLNSMGQFLEHSPFCERDIKLPQDLETHDETGDFKVMIRKGNPTLLTQLAGMGIISLMDSAYTTTNP
jgi:homogentisate 1,2-dioxygenase